MKKILMLIMLCLSLFFISSFSKIKVNATINDDIKKYVSSYVSNGLVSLYSGKYNTLNGHDNTSNKWYNLVGTNSISLSTNSTNYFNEDSFHLKSSKQYFTDLEKNTVNGNEFTLEFIINNFTPLGSSYNTFVNSSNDNFALFRRISSNVLEFKFAGIAQASRPTVNDASYILNYTLISVTYKVNGSVKIYINGELKAEKPCYKAMGADNLYFGHSDSSRNFEVDYQTFRFYSRELTSNEILENAKVDDMYGINTQEKHYNNLSLGNTNIIGGINAIERINYSFDLDNIQSYTNLPQAVIYTLDSDLNLILKDSTTITLKEALEKNNDTMIPIFEIFDEVAAENLIKFITKHKYYDSFVMSSNSNLVKIVRTKVPNIYGAIDYTNKYKDSDSILKFDMLNIRKDMHSNYGTVAILPLNICTHNNVQYLYDSVVNVWCNITNNDNVSIYQAITSGAIGVISNDSNKVMNIAKNDFNQNSMTRLPLNIGHRGLPKVAPENTLEGAILAYENGADVIELDIYLTTDNQIVIMHDSNSNRTCNKNYIIESYTLAQLKELYVNKGFETNPKYMNCKIPTLEEYFQEFKGKDVRLFIEIKSSKEAIVPATKALIEKYDIYDQVSFITFNQTQIANLYKYYPEATSGLLCYGTLDETNSQEDMLAVMSSIGKYNSTLNPSKDGYGKEALLAALSRGISVYPWTFNTQSEYTKYFMNGYSGLTGNDCRMLSSFAKTLNVNYQSIEYYVHDTLNLNVDVIKYDRTSIDVSENIKIKILDDNRDDFVYTNSISFNKPGTINFIISYEYTIDLSNKYTIYSDVIAINILEKESTEVPTETEEPTPVETKEPTPVETKEPTPVETKEPTPIVTEEPTPIETDEPTPVETEEPTPIEPLPKKPENIKSGCKNLLICLFVSLSMLGMIFIKHKKY